MLALERKYILQHSFHYKYGYKTFYYYVLKVYDNLCFADHINYPLFTSGTTDEDVKYLCKDNERGSSLPRLLRVL